MKFLECARENLHTENKIVPRTVHFHIGQHHLQSEWALQKHRKTCDSKNSSTRNFLHEEISTYMRPSKVALTELKCFVGSKMSGRAPRERLDRFLLILVCFKHRLMESKKSHIFICNAINYGPRHGDNKRYGSCTFDIKYCLSFWPLRTLITTQFVDMNNLKN